MKVCLWPGIEIQVMQEPPGPSGASHGAIACKLLRARPNCQCMPLGSCFAEKSVCRNVLPNCWDFFTEIGRGGIVLLNYWCVQPHFWGTLLTCLRVWPNFQWTLLKSAPQPQPGYFECWVTASPPPTHILIADV